MTQTPARTLPAVTPDRPRNAPPHWVYQETVRRIFDTEPDRRLRLVDTAGDVGMLFTPDVSPDFVIRPSQLWVFETGPHRLAQVECVREIPKTLITRMLLYRSAIAQAHPRARLDQYVIVVGDGRTRPPDEPVHSGTYFGLKVLYLRDVEPEWFGASPGFAFLQGCSVAPGYAEILEQAGMSLGRFLISVQDDVHDAAVLHDGGGQARTGIPEQLLSLYFQGRFGRHPVVPVERRSEGWPITVAVGLAVHAITDFHRLTAYWGIH